MKGNEMAKRDPKAAAVSTADKCIKAEAAKAESKPAPQTDEERAVLFYQWKDKYRAAAFDKKVADDALKAVASGAKAELGKNAVKDIKLAIELEDNPGEADIGSPAGWARASARSSKWSRARTARAASGSSATMTASSSTRCRGPRPKAPSR